MNFLRLHLPGLHQALRGALDSFSTFISYLVGDEVPTTGEREAQVAEGLEVGPERPRKAVEEAAQEAQEGLGSSQNQGSGGPRGSGGAKRHREGNSAAEHTWGWGEGSSYGSQAERHDAGAPEAAKAAKDQGPLETEAPAAGSAMDRDGSNQTQERPEPEVNQGETLRIWKWEEQEEVEEEVRAEEPGVAKGVESEWAWHREPVGKAGVGWPDAAGDDNGEEETEQAGEGPLAEDTWGPEVRELGTEEEEIVVASGVQLTVAQEPPGLVTEPEACTASGREEVRALSQGAIFPGEGTPVGWEHIWVREEASRRAGEDEGEQEQSQAEEIPMCRQTQALGTQGVKEGAGDQGSGIEAAGDAGSEEDAGDSCEGQAEQDRKESEERPCSEDGADQIGLGGEVQAEEAEEEKAGGWGAEAGLPQDSEARGAGGDADTESAPEAGPQKVFTGQWSGEGAQPGQGALSAEWGGLGQGITEGQEPEQMGGPQSPTKKPEGSQWVEEEPLWEPAPGGEAAEEVLRDDPQSLGYDVQFSGAEAWQSGRGRTMEGAALQLQVATEGLGEGAAGGQVLQNQEVAGQCGEAEGSGLGTEEEEAPETEPQEPGGDLEVEAETGGPLEESAAKDGEGEASGPWGAEEVPPSFQDSEEEAHPRSPMATETVEAQAVQDVKESGLRRGAGEAGERELERGWGSDELAQAVAGEELPKVLCREAIQGEDSLENSSEVTGKSHQEEAQAVGSGGEEGMVGGSAEAEGHWGMESFTPGSSEVTVEGAEPTGEAEGLPREWAGSRTEAGVWQAVGQGPECEGQHGDPHLKGGAPRSFELEDVEEAGDQKPEAVEAEEATEWREAEEGGQAEEAKEIGGAREGEEAEEAGEAGEAVEAAEAGEAREADDAQEAEEAVEAAEAGEAREADNAEEGGQAEEAEEAGEAEEDGEGGDTGEAQEVGEVQEVREALEAVQNEEAEQAEEAEPAGETEAAGEADLEGPEAVKGQKAQPTRQGPTETEPVLGGEAEVSEAPGHACGEDRSSWQEALLPGSRLDVSVSRSRALLSRSSSQRRSRPSFRRTPAPGALEEPPILPPEAELSAPPQISLQAETPPAPSPPKPEGTPVPARRRPLGHGFGLAHAGMMQELQARLGQPKPQ
ncbi:apolipoprotein B receptor [Tenrec ecaudatus]|uniref:apolipoprotein B receptor n=1 Tax=Tenrec ecaudatus TaxID=94439 RepID=UPI003F5A8566